MAELAADGPWVAVRAPAKLNLFLAVRGMRRDGYHELVTVFQTVGLFDELRFGVVGPPGRGHHPAARRRMRLAFEQPDLPELGAPDANLAVQAARALGATAGIGDLRLTDGDGCGSEPLTLVQLSKGIPVAGGMAGGSADAAAALLGLNRLWGLEQPKERLRDLGAELGSDVPFCVIGGTALATGRGTAMAQVLCRGTFHWVVCRSAEPLSTPAVYRSWDRTCRPSEIEPDAVLAALRTGDALALGAALHNDLEPAAVALRPALAEHKAALLDADALGAVLAGSGPTLLALAADAADAHRIADAVADRFDAVHVASSPAGGPELRSG